jgi:cobalamin biosynthesis protein CobT
MAGSIANIINKYDPSEPPPSGEEEGGSKGESGSDDTSTPSSSKMSKEELDEAAKNYIKSLLSDPDKHDKSGDDKDDFADFVDEMTSADDMTLDYNDEAGNRVSGSIEFVKVENDFEEYKDALKQIDVTKAGVLRKLFARKNKDYDFAIRSMRSGRLDTNKIAEAKQGVATIYERIGNIKTDKISVTVLIDESGSMNSSNRIGKAQQAAIFINEVFSGVPNVELFIYGHTADINGFDTTILVYKEPGHTSNKWSLGNVKARSQNRDGHAILAVAKRVRKHTQNAGIMLVMSDGQPCASRYSGSEGVKDTRKKVTEAQKLGFQVIQIAIDEHVDSKEMFDHYIKMTKIKDLPIDMVNYLSRKVDRLVKERITL